jgi:hypothetical protein
MPSLRSLASYLLEVRTAQLSTSNTRGGPKMQEAALSKGWAKYNTEPQEGWVNCSLHFGFSAAIAFGVSRFELKM